MKLFRMLEIVLPVIAMLSLGFLARRKGIISREGAAGIKTLVLRFTLPMVIFNALYRVQAEGDLLWYVAAVLACCIAGFLLGRLAARLLRMNPLLPFFTCAFENSMLAVPLFTLLFGEEQLSHMVLLNIAHVLFVYAGAMPLAQKYCGLPREGTLKSILSSTALQSLALALLLSLTGWGRKLDASVIGPVVSGVTSFISRPTAAAILFVMGYDLKLSRGYLREAAMAAGVRLVIMGALLAAALFLLGLVVDIPEYRRYAFIVMFMTPTALVIPIFFEREEQVAYLSTCNSFYMLPTMLLYTAFAAIVA